MDLIPLAGYAGPPVIGAFIGYLTNKVAIKMLFRPLKPWKVFGVRVPMTPGVIPSKRHELADNIGEMVGEHLLTSKEIGQALSREPFQEHLNELIQKRAQDLLGKELGPISSFIPEAFGAHYKVAVQILKKQIGIGLDRFLTSDEWEKRFHKYLTYYFQQIGDHDLSLLISHDSRVSFYDFVGSLSLELLAAPETKKYLGKFIYQQISLLEKEEATLKQLFPGQFEDLLQEVIKKQTPILLDSLGKKISEPVIRKELLEGIGKGVDHFIDSLGSVGAMARGFIDMDNLQTIVDSYLDEKENEICQWLQKRTVCEQVEDVFINRINEFIDQPLSNLLENVDEQSRQQFCDIMAEKILFVAMNNDREQMASFVEGIGEAWLATGQATLNNITEQICIDSERDLQRTITDKIIAFIKSKSVVNAIPVFTENAVDMLLQQPVGRLGRIIPVSVNKGIADYAALTTNRVLLKEVPGLVKSLRINKLVTEKVNSLDLLRLERLLLSIMEEQFKYINLFGALLGFIIGCLNLILLKFI